MVASRQCFGNKLWLQWAGKPWPSHAWLSLLPGGTSRSHFPGPTSLGAILAVSSGPGLVVLWGGCAPSQPCPSSCSTPGLGGGGCLRSFKLLLKLIFRLTWVESFVSFYCCLVGPGGQQVLWGSCVGGTQALGAPGPSGTAIHADVVSC